MIKINTKPFLTPADLEAQGLWTAKTIYNRVNTLKNFPIPFIKLDKEIRFRSSEVEKYLQSRTVNQL